MNAVYQCVDGFQRRTRQRFCLKPTEALRIIFCSLSKVSSGAAPLEFNRREIIATQWLVSRWLAPQLPVSSSSTSQCCGGQLR